METIFTRMNSQDVLVDWLNTQLVDYRIEALPNDASFRRYFRIYQNKNTFIAMDASAEKASCEPFIAIANALRSQGLLTPTIFASDLTQGFLLISDFGDHSYLKILNSSNAILLYQLALDALFHLQQCSEVPGWKIPIFSVDLMRKELDLFQEWFLEKYLGLNLLNVKAELAKDFDLITDYAAQQPLVFMHRDFHSANLMHLPQKKVGILDFQDAFVGPITYDLVSLLRDCYIAWPETMIHDLVHYYWKKLALAEISFEQFLRWFDWMGLQRHLKALLTFSRKYCRDGDKHYLQHIPRTLQYVLTTSQRYPELKFLHTFLTDVKAECVE